jgi:hypothetical protein
MPALVAGIHVLNAAPNKDVDGRNKSGHDEPWCNLYSRDPDRFRFQQIQRVGWIERSETNRIRSSEY